MTAHAQTERRGSQTVREDRFLGTLVACDVQNETFVIELPTGERLSFRCEDDSGVNYVSNHRDSGFDTPSGLTLEPALRMSKGRMVSVRGLTYEGEPDRFCKELTLLTDSQGAYLTESSQWWQKQAVALGDFWIRAQRLTPNRNGRVNPSGYRTLISKTGEPRATSHNDKDHLVQESATLSRLVYGICSAYLMNGNPEYLQAAEALVSYQREHMRVEIDGERVFWLHAFIPSEAGAARRVYGSLQPPDEDTIPLYEQIYCLAGLTQYYRITRDAAVLSDIRKTMAFMDYYYWDPVGEGYFSHLAPAPFLPDAPSDIRYRRAPALSGLTGENGLTKNWNSIGDHLPAYLFNLYLGTADRSCEVRLRRLAKLIASHFPVEDSPFVLERFDRSWNPVVTYGWQQDRGVVGHNTKIVWVLTQMALLTGDEDLLETARGIADKMLLYGEDRTRGGWFDVLERHPNVETGRHLHVWHTRKAFWQQEQGILSQYILHAATQDRRYLNAARRGAAFYNMSFLDHFDGGIYFDVQNDGTPYLHEDLRVNKGSHAKAGYHSLELTYYAHLYINLLLHRRPVTLYFRPRTAREGEVLPVSPIVLPPGRVRLRSVRINDRTHTQFDSRKLEVRLPASASPLNVEVLLEPTPVAPGQASDSSTPTAGENGLTVTLVGDLQRDLGAESVWDPTSAATQMPPLEDKVYCLRGTLGPGRYDYKVALNRTWVENFGQNGVPGGENVHLALDEETDISFYFSDHSKIITDSTRYRWLPLGDRPRLKERACPLHDFDLDGVYTTRFAASPGQHEFTIDFEGKAYVGIVSIPPPGRAIELFFHLDSGKVEFDLGKLELTRPNHDTFSPIYRTPFEALPAGKPLTLRLSTQKGLANQVLVQYVNGSIQPMGGVTFNGPGQSQEMLKIGGVDLPQTGERDYWEATVRLDAPGIYGYKFRIDDVGEYGDDILAGGSGAAARRARKYFRVTVYDPSFRTPDWFKGAVVYQIMPDRFRNGDASNDDARRFARGNELLERVPWNSLPSSHSNEYFCGDIDGIIQKLDYLQSLGVSVLYLTPFLDAASYHRYDFRDFFKVDSLLGGQSAYARLRRELSTRGMSLISDGVFGHCGDDSIYFDRYGKYGHLGAYEFWASVYDVMNESNADLEAARKLALERLTSQGQKPSPYGWHDWFDILNRITSGPRPHYEYHSFSGFDSLPEFHRELTDLHSWMRFVLHDDNSVVHAWGRKGVAGWRLDAAPHLGHEFPRALRRELHKRPLPDGRQPLILAEMFNDASAHFLGDQFDTVMNYPFREAVLDRFLLQRDAAGARHLLMMLRQNYPKETFLSLMNVIDSHDVTRAIYHLGEGGQSDRAVKGDNFDYDLGKSRLKLALAFQMVYPGSPCIYYGTEAGVFGAADPDNRRPFPWGQEDKEILGCTQALAGLRRQHPHLFSRGELLELYAEGEVYIFGRLHGDSFIVAALNGGVFPAEVTLDMQGAIGNGVALRDQLDARYTVRSENNHLRVFIPGMTARVLVADGRLVDAARLPAYPVRLFSTERVVSAQLLGTVNEHRCRWNPFSPLNDLDRDPAERETFIKTFPLHCRGGRNADGVYAVRFVVNHDFNRTYKLDQRRGAPHLVTGNRRRARNILFSVKDDGDYVVRFSPKRSTFSIAPARTTMTEVEYLREIESVQLNGFVWDDQKGLFETRNNWRTFPIQKWDETESSHNMRPAGNGFWKKRVFLRADGGMSHRRDGVYQFLFSANGIGDWGFGAINGRPGQLSQGCSYDGKSGALTDSDIVVRVTKDGWYDLRFSPRKLVFAISPNVEIVNRLQTYQVNGPVVPNAWDPTHPEHEMTQCENGLWVKEVQLSSRGGPGQNGVYSLNVSINNEWMLDSLGLGAWLLAPDKNVTLARLWHTKPQEPNVLFRALNDGTHTIVFDPKKQELSISPAVQPACGVRTLRLVGDTYANPQDQWDPFSPATRMDSADGVTFYKRFHLRAGRTYSYKHVANEAGFLWSFADYVFDGYRELSVHGNPPNLEFRPAETGDYVFEANVVTGAYRVYSASVGTATNAP